jgi:hypothetical protein
MGFRRNLYLHGLVLGLVIKMLLVNTSGVLAQLLPLSLQKVLKMPTIGSMENSASREN